MHPQTKILHLHNKLVYLCKLTSMCTKLYIDKSWFGDIQIIHAYLPPHCWTTSHFVTCSTHTHIQTHTNTVPKKNEIHVAICAVFFFNNSNLHIADSILRWQAFLLYFLIILIHTFFFFLVLIWNVSHNVLLSVLINMNGKNSERITNRNWWKPIISHWRNNNTKT